MTKKEYRIKIVEVDTGKLVTDLGSHKFLHDVNEPAYSEYFARSYGEDYMENEGFATDELKVVVAEV